MACHLRWWPGNNIDERLGHAYSSFNAWRRLHRVNTTVVKFELKTFKCTSLSSMHYFTHDVADNSCSCMVFQCSSVSCDDDMNAFNFLGVEASRFSKVWREGLRHLSSLPLALQCGSPGTQWPTSALEQFGLNIRMIMHACLCTCRVCEHKAGVHALR